MFRDSLADTKRQYREAEQKVATIGREFTAKKNAMKEAKSIADKEAPLEDADGDPLPLKAELEALSVTTLAETEAAMEEATAKVAGIDANPDVIRQYEERKKEIETTRGQLEDLTNDKDFKANEINKKRGPWEQCLENAVSEVNELFSNYMKELGNAGTITMFGILASYIHSNISFLSSSNLLQAKSSS